MNFEWDGAKAAANVVKHGVACDFAIAVFQDRHCVEIDVTREIDKEARFKCIGLIDHRLFVVVFHWRDGVCRIISARRTNKQEERVYENR
jgi:uncharacterized protein